MNDDLDAALARHLHTLPHELAPPPPLEQRVLASLRQRRLVGRPHRSLRLAGLAAAAVLLVAGGVTLGRAGAARSVAPGLGRYLVLLYEGPGFDTAGDSAAAAARVAEYRSWAQSLAARRRLVAGEELGTPEMSLVRSGRGAAVGPAGDAAGLPTGFFIVAARDSADAVALAETCPHLRHGGRVVVRGIRPT